LTAGRQIPKAPWGCVDDNRVLGLIQQGAIHGADALALYAQCKEKIKIVLMDMIMPVMDGVTAIRTVKKQQPDLPCIAISGLMQSDKLKERLGDAEVMFLPKPYTTDQLLRNIRKLLVSSAR